MGSALLNPAAALEFAETVETVAPVGRSPDAGGARAEHAAAVPGTVDELRKQVAERLAAHRSRRAGAKTPADVADAVRPAGTRSARIAAAVAERYAQTPSYRAVLAAEAERATQQARAAAEVAALNAQAIAAAQQRLLAAYDEQVSRTNDAAMAGLPAQAIAVNLWPEPETAQHQGEKQVPASIQRGDENGMQETAAALKSPDVVAAARPTGGFTVRLYDDMVAARHPGAGAAVLPDTFRSGTVARRSGFAESSAAEAMALDEEIAFRHTPVFEEPAGPPVALPANLIEFPRQLVAARKARPRYAEGPLRDEADGIPSDGQLRIFEVDPAQIATSAEQPETGKAQWTSIWLDAPTETRGAESALDDASVDEPLGYVTASIEAASFARRGTAAAINFAIVAAGVGVFSAMAVATIGRDVSWHTGLPLVDSLRQIAAELGAQTNLQLKSAGILGGVSGVVLLLVYHALFFLFSMATPGMRCVRIAYCTFEDGNPTRRAVRRRMLATLLSACPLGMGYAWAALDEERLTWHDRMSRMYLRQY